MMIIVVVAKRMKVRLRMKVMRLIMKVIKIVKSMGIILLKIV